MAFDPKHAVPVAGLQVDRGWAIPQKSAAELGAERAAADSSTGERFLAGVGHGFVNLGRGLQQGALWAADEMHLDGASRARQALQKDIDNAQGIDQALLSTPAGRVGDFVGTTAATALIPGANTYRGAMLAGGVLGALEPTATGESRLENTIAGAANGVAGKAIGDAAGLGVKYVLGRVAAARNAARQAENAARQIKDRPPPTAPGPPQGPPPSTNSTVPIAPPPAGRVVSGGGNHAPELTDEERRVAAEAAGVQPHEVPPETAEVAHLVHSDPESALRIHAEHPENTDAFLAAVRERNHGNAEGYADQLADIGAPGGQSWSEDVARDTSVSVPKREQIGVGGADDAETGQQPEKRRVFCGVEIHPALPPPAAGWDYVPKPVARANTDNQRLAHWNGFQAEIRLANQLADLGHVVVKWGANVNGHGSDIISIHPRTGEVTLWDSKYRSGSVLIGESPTFDKSGTRLAAIREARRVIRKSSLDPDMKEKALQNMKEERFTANTVGAGAVKNSVTVRRGAIIEARNDF